VSFSLCLGFVKIIIDWQRASYISTLLLDVPVQKTIHETWRWKDMELAGSLAA